MTIEVPKICADTEKCWDHLSGLETTGPKPGESQEDFMARTALDAEYIKNHIAEISRCMVEHAQSGNKAGCPMIAVLEARARVFGTDDNPWMDFYTAS